MPNTKEVPEVGNIYLYEDHVPRKSRWSKIPFIGYFRQKLKMDEKELEDKRQAIMKKNGKYRVRYAGLNGYKRKYLNDLYISMIDLKWRYAFALFFNMYLLSFLFFGIMWWIIAYNHGDFDHVNDPAWEPCVSSVYSFPKCLLFSIETQTTIGYGVAYPNTDCDGTLFMVYMQITIGILIDNLLLGFMFVKFAQPKKRQKTILFSKNACITHSDGDLAIQIRVGDLRKSHLLAAQVHGVLVRRHVTDEGVLHPLYMSKVEFKADAMEDTLVLMWPMVLTHKITEDSPFYDIKPADLTNEKYELIVFIEGTIETTGEFCQVRTSYTPREFLWGHRFDRIEEFDSGNGRWEIDFAAFNDVVYTNNIRHSARELCSFRRRKVVPTLDKQDEHMEKVPPIQTKNLKTVSYGVGPELPVRNYEKRELSFGNPQNETGYRSNDEESDDTVIEKRPRRSDSVVSFETAADTASLNGHNI
ncbi:G protein-activated inward rectifier potassium channel 4-like [Ruditapes philippinarum]|uniref:G protein-activated inward rectifier potassium channel 4-like n=1 Tax=Ruditapes philippinarum TaxID=129788 RepID=UPI00295A8CC7|nr:G protein-activated inward rectifier potassium channel 4-like [Ruditapes philippinarum]